eukprot:4360239-Pyramimonas_sp.AAC.1
MVLMLREALAKRGRRLHPTKCNMQTNRVGGVVRGDVVLDEGFSVNVLSEGDNLEVMGTAYRCLTSPGRKASTGQASLGGTAEAVRLFCWGLYALRGLFLDAESCIILRVGVHPEQTVAPYMRLPASTRQGVAP